MRSSLLCLVCLIPSAAVADIAPPDPQEEALGLAVPQEDPSAEPDAPADGAAPDGAALPEGVEGLPPELLAQLQAMASIAWTEGPTQGAVGELAQLLVPEGVRFTGAEGARQMLEFWGNPTGGGEMAMFEPLAEDKSWSGLFEWEASGYVKDDDAAELDADELLASIRQGTEAANEARVAMGGSPMTVVGWEVPPTYDAATKHLVWAIRGKSEHGATINYNVRLLGREGVMSAILLADPDSFATDRAEFEQVLGGFSFQDGKRYADFRKGDRVAAYGLAALVAGGVGAAAVKSGLLQKLFKPLLLAAAAFAASAKRLFGRGERG